MSCASGPLGKLTNSQQDSFKQVQEGTDVGCGQLFQELQIKQIKNAEEEIKRANREGRDQKGKRRTGKGHQHWATSKSPRGKKEWP